QRAHIIQRQRTLSVHDHTHQGTASYLLLETAFNARIAAIPQELAMLRTLMDQYGLNQSSFQKEIGRRSLVSMIMNGQRALTLD
ncbi:hypothetical protein ACC771_21690, partial [Rhizobium ruizarguesonis]